jgi:hypothetical protein
MRRNYIWGKKGMRKKEYVKIGGGVGNVIEREADVKKKIDFLLKFGFMSELYKTFQAVICL